MIYMLSQCKDAKDNPAARIERFSLFFSNCFEENILLVSQLFNSEGLLLSSE